MTSAATILRESAQANINRPWRMVIGAFLIGALTAAPALLDMIAAWTLDTTLIDETARGANVLVVENDGGTIDARECVATQQLQGVLYAGAVSAPDLVTLGDAGIVTARRVLATPGYLEIMAYPRFDGLRGYAILGPALTRELSIQESAAIKISGEGAITMVSALSSGRADAQARWVTMPIAPRGEAQQCWIETTRQSLDSVHAVIPYLFTDARALSVDRLRDGKVSDVATRNRHERSTSTLSIAGGIAASLVAGILVWPRRHEYALYRLLGMSRARVALIAAGEAQVLLALGFLLAGVAVCSATLAIPGLLAVGGSHLLIASAVAMFLTYVSVTGMVSGNTAQILRNRA